MYSPFMNCALVLLCSCRLKYICIPLQFYVHIHVNPHLIVLSMQQTGKEGKNLNIEEYICGLLYAAKCAINLGAVRTTPSEKKNS